MRKLAPILLIAVLLFNMFGYQGLFLGIRIKNTHDLLVKFDNESYTPQETFTVAIPMAVPYHVDDEDYKRVNGEIEFQGETYRLIKQKVANDTLYIVCLTDVQSKNIKNTFADYVKTFADKHSDNSKSNGKLFQNFIKDYIASSLSLESVNNGWYQELIASRPPHTYPVNYCTSFIQPPEA